MPTTPNLCTDGDDEVMVMVTRMAMTMVMVTKRMMIMVEMGMMVVVITKIYKTGREMSIAWC